MCYSYKQWRGRHRYWNKTWRMPKKVKGSAPTVFPPQLENYQLWRVGIDEVLAVGSTVASISNMSAVTPYRELLYSHFQQFSFLFARPNS